MNRSILAAIALASILSACSSQPSDFRPGAKVSVDAVPPGERDTDIYNLNGKSEDAHKGHGASSHETHTDRPDVQLNHDEHASDFNEQTPAEETTTNAEQVENHE